MTTTDPLDALLYLRDGQVTARWNFADAVGSSLSAPGGLGNAVSLSYSFLSAAPSYFPTTGFASFSTAARDATREVLDMVSAVARVAFNEVAGVGTMTLGMNAQSGSAGFAYVPSYGYSYSGDTIVSVIAQPEAGDVWLNSNQGWTAADFEPGGSGFGTLVHEIGHALGLKHPFEADSPGGYTLDPALDNKAWTVMSYTEHPHGLFRTVTDNGGGSYSWQYEYIQPETMMPYDIVALQYLYGANTTTRAGNDSYTFDPARPFIKTITDAGGTDTISVANFSKGSVIDLRDGHFSSIRIPSDTLPPGATETNTDIYDGTDNLAIAFGVVIENATGGSGADRLTGNAVANRLDGGAGNDTMTGGAGNDSYVVSSSGDVISETSTLATEVDSVISSISWTLGSYLERLTLSGSGALNGTGNTLSNTLTGNTGANSLSGADGNDTLLGGDGIDTLLGGNGNDSLDGGSGNDSLTGGAGNDVYVVQSSADKTIEASGGGTADSVSASLGWTLAAEVENLTLTGSSAINGTGNTLANRLTGNAVANVLDGGAGNDTMTGGAGNDTYVVSSSGDVISETSTLATEVDSVISSVSWTLGSTLERLNLSGSSALNGTGNALANLLTGNTGANSLSGADGNDTLLGGDGIDTLLGGNGNDSLDGGSGNDSLTGGAGNDVYVVQSSADKTIEASGGGTADSVSASLAWTLAAEVENLTLTGTSVINGTGNALANRLTGNAVANLLDGGTGNDTMVGGDGSDTYYLGQSGDSASETNASASSGGTDLVCSWLPSCTLGTNIENGQIKTTGTASLTGNALNNVLYAGAGNNVLNGGTGTDTADYRYAGAAVTVSLAPTTGQATGGSGTDTLLGIESLIGSALADRLTGSSVANTLNGGAGADTLTGGDGSDNYYLDHSGDLVVESNATASTGGTDTVYSSLAAYTLGSNVENGRVNTTAAASITGNSLNNAIRAGAGNNTLNGGSGTDTVDYGTAASAVTVSLATTAAQATGGSGSDTLSLFENLLGSGHNDTLTGSSGANDLTGAAGSDRLSGGAGADRFFLNSLSGSDTLTDFSSASDKIVVSQAAIRVGDGDTTVEGAVTKSGPGGFATSAELVVISANISGSITTTSAAAKIGSATSAYAVGAKALFMVDNGAASALYLFTAAGADAAVSSSELTLLATLSATATTLTTDLLFGA